LTFLEPTFPPLLDGRIVVRGDSPLALAIAGADAGELGAGDALWLQDTAQVELAIVLEPDDPLEKAAQMMPLAVAAAGDCLAALTPPQVGVHFRWPGTLLLNGAAAGTCSLTVPADCGLREVPKWMVLNFSLRFAFDETAEPGTTPGITSLAEEGGEELTTVDVIESYSRHFLSLLDTWSNDGFADIAQNWGGRTEGLEEATRISHPTGALTARVLGLDEDGNLLVRPADGGDTVALALIDCITRAKPRAGPQP
jgi:biotin-(acetyl-CoA carboxylase) ligase